MSGSMNDDGADGLGHLHHLCIILVLVFEYK